MRMSFVRFAAFLMALILCLSVVATALAYNTCLLYTSNRAAGPRCGAREYPPA